MGARDSAQKGSAAPDMTTMVPNRQGGLADERMKTLLPTQDPIVQLAVGSHREPGRQAPSSTAHGRPPPPRVSITASGQERHASRNQSKRPSLGPGVRFARPSWASVARMLGAGRVHGAGALIFRSEPKEKPASCHDHPNP